ncbi:M61 family metallopeptidase [Pseudochryseolinea flava]|uniref:M61 family peptidase n=1 Tax=Pseudochryseolinea flava TaxID=2059302 RepID=A0A364XXF5_9BACT|nr:M61 family metallopeptidase [Pseudochryseolinea flava]RAV98457.1 M61 family peptidase [Pseudochryseolinea flava]
MKIITLTAAILLCASMAHVSAQVHNSTDSINVNLHDDHACQCVDVTISITNIRGDTLSLLLPRWSPGYYQIMDYPNNVFDFAPTGSHNRALTWRKQYPNVWKIASKNNSTVIVRYRVKSSDKFVARTTVTPDFTYLVPTSLIMHPERQIETPILLTVTSDKKNKTIATGLKKVTNQQHKLAATDFDNLYDCPILIGDIETLQTFTVKNVPHIFQGYKLGNFDRDTFTANLQKIVETAVSIIDDIPYKQYTFLGIGPGQGGIEHSNSTTVAFDGNAMATRESQLRMYSFLAHEYFHHYNVKRIRPIELGPFDYSHENRTKQLWISEGITVYYDHLILARAGLSTADELLKSFSALINHYESGTGKNFQTLADASYHTWSDGPFGRQGDAVNKTISVYEKGTIVALLLDLRIRTETAGRKSLDDVMKTVYYEYYKKHGRGFTEEEFRKVCEHITKSKLTDFFDYIYTLTPIDYTKYFTAAGLDFKENKDGKGRSLSFTVNSTKQQAKILATWLKND